MNIFTEFSKNFGSLKQYNDDKEDYSNFDNEPEILNINKKWQVNSVPAVKLLVTISKLNLGLKFSMP